MTINNLPNAAKWLFDRMQDEPRGEYRYFECKTTKLIKLYNQIATWCKDRCPTFAPSYMPHPEVTSRIKFDGHGCWSIYLDEGRLDVHGSRTHIAVYFHPAATFGETYLQGME